jgi:hypothetical protein
VHNIELLVRQLDLDLHTLVIEWDEMRDLQVAFLKASVLNQAIPQDHAFFATLYRTARQFGLHHFLSGVNYATECVVPPLWGHPSMDGKHLRAIQQRFGAAALATFPVMGLTEFLWMTRVRRQVTIHRPLNYLAYDKEQARVELREAYGWRDYGGKHCESRFTKFYQEIYLPKKFHFDKRRLHLSSLIVSGLMTRAQALEELATSITTAEQEKRDMRFVAKKLAINVAELESYLSSAPIDHLTYPNQMSLHGRLTSLKRLARRFSKAPP